MKRIFSKWKQRDYVSFVLWLVSIVLALCAVYIGMDNEPKKALLSFSLVIGSTALIINCYDFVEKSVTLINRR